MSKRFDFLFSNRFWAVIIGAVSIYLKTKGFIGEPEMILIATVTSAFTIIRTVDRSSEIAGTGKMPKQPDTK